MAGEHVSSVALVIDDEPFARLFAVQVFLDHGFTVLEASDAEEGLQVLDRNDDVSVVFTDINMPGEMNGLGLVRRLGAERPDLALILTSGQTAPSEAEAARTRFVAKPYSAHALLAAIQGVS